MRILTTSLISLLLLASPAAFAAEELTCTVASIHDGDSMRVRCPGSRGTQRVRMNQIDAPELEQAYGKEARKRLEQLCPRNSTAVIELHGRDQYDRLLGNVRCGKHKVNEEMVASGAAWVYKTHSDDPELSRLEAEARKEKRGLWSSANPQQPWRWRYEQRQR